MAAKCANRPLSIKDWIDPQFSGSPHHAFMISHWPSSLHRCVLEAINRYWIECQLYFKVRGHCEAMRDVTKCFLITFKGICMNLSLELNNLSKTYASPCITSVKTIGKSSHLTKFRSFEIIHILRKHFFDQPPHFHEFFEQFVSFLCTENFKL